MLSASATTRQPRPGEVHGKDYIFLNREQFEKMVADEDFAEWAEYIGELYGTPRDPLDKAVNDGLVVLLDIDVQGGRQVMEKYPEATTIFIGPPRGDMSIIERRLEARGTDSPEQRARRIERARHEVEQGKTYRFHVENDDLETAIERVKEIALGTSGGDATARDDPHS